MAQAQLKPARNAVQALDHGWQFRQVTAGARAGRERLAPRRVRDVIWDLLANKKIPDPFVRETRPGSRWHRRKESWEYRLSFEGHAGLQPIHVDLVFDGLDGAARSFP